MTIRTHCFHLLLPIFISTMLSSSRIIVASRRTAAFVKSSTTTTARRRTVVTATRASSSWHQPQTHRTTVQQQPSLHQRSRHLPSNRRGFFTQIMNMISGNSSSNEASSSSSEEDEEVTAESLVAALQEKYGDDKNKDHEFIGNGVGEAALALYEADAVCFDVDSTVINEEGIDVLADFLGKGDEVAALTAAAMEGGMKFQDALTKRLDLLQPSKSQILACLEKHPLELTPGVEKLIATLHAKGVNVFLVSGGFRIMIEPVAKILKINPKTNIYANTILFNETGDDEHAKSMCGTTYGGFDAKEPTSQDMGKPRAVQLIMDNHFQHRVVMIGDGATDAQAKPPATAFVGFGGVVERDAVKQQADWFVTSFDELTTIVEMRKDPTKKDAQE
mmetsp:Transcript_12953/g.14841  ORF Transcript_12953/g.14841 Transcript_12953/m.14841 type:complete len:390 (+) Transcript_12953:51-1220(+)